MPLNISPGSGDFIPYLKYNAKAGRWYTKNDDGIEVEVGNMTAIFDLENIGIGWALYAEGQAPDCTWSTNGTMPPRPSKQHKQGLRTFAYAPKALFGQREFATTASGTIGAVKRVYEEEFENAPERRQGLVPVVKCTGVKPEKTARGTNYIPELKIVKWTQRPSDMPNTALPPPSANGSAGKSTGDFIDDDLPDFGGPIKRQLVNHSTMTNISPKDLSDLGPRQIHEGLRTVGIRPGRPNTGGCVPSQQDATCRRSCLARGPRAA
jgi:hypothetical protein